MKALVTLDGSELSQRIIPVVHRLCEVVPTAEIHLLTVADPDAAAGRATRADDHPQGTALGTGVLRSPMPRVIESHGDAMARARSEIEDRLRPIGREFGDRFAGLDVRWSKDPAGQIITCADELAVDVIVMATHGRSGLSHLLAGSVAEAVIRRSERPVLVFCPRDR